MAHGKWAGVGGEDLGGVFLPRFATEPRLKIILRVVVSSQIGIQLRSLRRQNSPSENSVLMMTCQREETGLIRYPSPLRYPGGKSGLADFISNVLALNDLTGCVYFEPYAGGAGAALRLLQRQAVSEVYLNDADRRVIAFWKSALNATEKFVHQIHSVPLTIEEWQRQHSICDQPRAHNQFEVGFATFFMNRCNRSGVLSGAGPIGGYEQSGKWRMSVRFNRDSLAERIISLASMKDRIHISCNDAVTFLKGSLPQGLGRRRVFVYLDPPYVNNGRRLYLNAYKPKDHAKLAAYIDQQKKLPWIMSYDDTDLVRELYSAHNIASMPIPYSLQHKRFARELIIAPGHVSVPHACRIRGRENILQDLRLKGEVS